MRWPWPKREHFAVVIEGVKEDVARHITAQVKIPTIGIGASPACDGQVLVIDDMLGLTGHTPSFVKHYAHLAKAIENRRSKPMPKKSRSRTVSPAPNIASRLGKSNSLPCRGRVRVGALCCTVRAKHRPPLASP